MNILNLYVCVCIYIYIRRACSKIKLEWFFLLWMQCGCSWMNFILNFVARLNHWWSYLHVIPFSLTLFHVTYNPPFCAAHLDLFFFFFFLLWVFLFFPFRKVTLIIYLFYSHGYFDNSMSVLCGFGGIQVRSSFFYKCSWLGAGEQSLVSKAKV
jgi:hypothetical protein